MRLLATVEVFDKFLRPIGLQKGPRGQWARIVDHVTGYGEGDALVVVKQGGERRPTLYTCSRLLPVENTDTASLDTPLYKFPRVKRPGFHSEYRVVENYITIEPKHHVGMVRELVHFMKLMNQGKPVGWKDLRMLDGVPIRIEDRKCACCVGASSSRRC